MNRNMDRTPAVMTLAEWDKLLPGGVMAGDVFEAQENQLYAWSKGGRYIVQTNGMVCDNMGNYRPNAKRTIQPFTLITSGVLALKDMTPEQAGPIMDAFRQGNPVQAFSNGAWNAYRGEGLKPGGAYRLLPKPVATMDWTGIHPDITHVAMDKDGMVWLCEGEPCIKADHWGGVTFTWRIDNILSPCPFQANGAHWKDTLISRPKEHGE